MNTSACLLLFQAANFRVGQELDLLEHRIETLENALERHMSSEKIHEDGDAIQAIQEIDLVRQTVKSLADFLMTISDPTKTLEPETIEAAIERVPLRDVAARLNGGKAQAKAIIGTELF
ncbi:hypothetical protein [Tropicibacter alexandrii]|uniref:hypothetical protein n=1 Tax=Tropicibacter alexandrii TaxID=2267683 RepID=UPI000EF49CF9|nr:hypothetical protein [Tropicibacter alexandrii]